jgi:hypothetical protein
MAQRQQQHPGPQDQPVGPPDHRGQRDERIQHRRVEAQMVAHPSRVEPQLFGQFGAGQQRRMAQPERVKAGQHHTEAGVRDTQHRTSRVGFPQ